MYENPWVRLHPQRRHPRECGPVYAGLELDVFIGSRIEMGRDQVEA